MFWQLKLSVTVLFIYHVHPNNHDKLFKHQIIWIELFFFSTHSMLFQSIMAWTLYDLYFLHKYTTWDIKAQASAHYVVSWVWTLYLFGDWPLT